MNNGWIKLHRSLLDWEWYSDMNVRVVFIHCLLKANCKDVKYKGKDILRGSFATGLELLSRETGLTIAQIRVTLNKLKMTSEITIQTSAEGSIISITNYDLYQSNDKQNDKPIASETTNEQQTNDKPIASNNNNKNDKNDKNKEKDTIVSKKKDKPSGLLPVYFQFMILGLTPDKAILKAEKFYSHYQSNGWKVSKNPMKDWKAATSGTWCDFTKAVGYQKDHLCYIVEELEKQYGDRDEYDQFDFAKLKHSNPQLFNDPEMFNDTWNKYLEGMNDR